MGRALADVMCQLLGRACLSRVVVAGGDSSGEIPPGAHLPRERELMEIYGVGRPAIREALRTLERCGIAEIVLRERARVVVPGAGRLIAQLAGAAMHMLRTQPDMPGHLKSARMFPETGRARMAAGRASGEDIARLQLKVAQQRASMVNPGEFIERDMAFHRETAQHDGDAAAEAMRAHPGRANELYRTLIRT